MKRINLLNKTFGRLTVLEEHEKSAEGLIQWRCACECGNEKIVPTKLLRNGSVKSCGCLATSKTKEKMIGARFGKLTIISDSGKRASNGHIIWTCQCDCGSTIDVNGDSLVQGATTTCGCFERVVDITGKRFGKLTVLEPTGIYRKDGSAYWRCVCDCGEEAICCGVDLRNGHVQSCGCLNPKHKIDLSGQKFGRLTVIGASSNIRNKTAWRCICECGTIVNVTTDNLTRGVTHSCGCLKSYGEMLVGEVLSDMKITFKKEFSFPDLLSVNNRVLRFDFAIFEEDKLFGLIEYDGEQHFVENCFEDTLEEIQFRDCLKNEYCYSHRIPLLRIKYDIKTKELIRELIINFLEGENNA